MRVFKFGGASIKDAEAIKNVAGIIADYKNEELVVVISALGKTTNALEEIVLAFYSGNEEDALMKVEALEDKHLMIMNDLFENREAPVFSRVLELFGQLGDTPKYFAFDNYNFLYDQIVCFGELISTTIVSEYLKKQGVLCTWLDVRSVLKTDKAYREAKINWNLTESLIKQAVVPELQEHIVITQGFLGSTSTDFTTTLGREGSDFTAAIFSNILEAEELCIWKDVPGVLNANPKLFSDAQKIDLLSYHEAIEQTYYGAQVIHPKTIKPLQNKSIPLHVRSFINKAEPGTRIMQTDDLGDIPPIIVYKEKQLLLTFSTKDFSFMAEENLGLIYDTFSQLRVKINLMQNAAISLSVCIDDNREKLEKLTHALENQFNIDVQEEVKVLTIRHYTQEAIDRLTEHTIILITQKSPSTVQFVIR